MKRIIASCILLLISMGGYGFSLKHMNRLRTDFLNYSFVHYSTPSSISGPLSLEFKGIVSDFLFLKLITVIGEKIGTDRLLENHSEYIYKCADAITDLDPYFWDAYIFSDMILSWEFERYREANLLLEKARKHRVDDYKPPYFLGFNHFYFLKDNKKGADYLVEASQLPGCPLFVAKLASRLYATEHNYESAIVFLKKVLETTLNQGVRQQLILRINTLALLDELQNKIDAYAVRYGQQPVRLEQLIEKGMIESLPKDPYGGEFYIQKDGRVFTTSKLRTRKVK